MSSGYGELIKAARRKAGLTQAMVAEKCNLATITVRQYENDKRNPSIEILKQLGRVLNVPWTTLVPDEEKGKTILKDFIENSGLTMVDSKGNVIKKGDGRKWKRISEAEANRLGILNFNSDKERTIFFYNLLNEDGKRVAGECFFEYLGDDVWKEVADYVAGLSENPLFQKRPSQPTQAPSLQDSEITQEDGEKPPEGPTEQNKG